MPRTINPRLVFATAILCLTAITTLPAQAQSETYRKAYAAAKALGKTELWSKAYADAYSDFKSGGKSDEVAKRYADAYASGYVSARGDGKSDNDAQAYGATYGRHALEKRY